MNMKNQFVSYQIAKELKDLGFNECCFSYFNSNEELTDVIVVLLDNQGYYNSNGLIVSPLWQQVIDWLREEHHILIGYIWNLQHIFTIDLKDQSIITEIIRSEYYKECREQAILKAIELIKSKP